MPDISLVLSIPRSPAEVRAWWLEMPDDYRATDPREQPFRIKTLSRTPTEWRILTYWRIGGRVVRIPERFEIRADGWTVHLDLPLGLKQRDELLSKDLAHGGSPVRARCAKALARVAPIGAHMLERVKRIFAKCPSDIDIVLLQNSNAHHVDMSFFYATDLVSGGGFERSAALLHRDGAIDILVPFLEETSAKRAKDATISIYQKPDERTAWLKERLHGRGKVGINQAELITTDFLALKDAAPSAQFVDVSKGVADARAVKDKVELARMKRAAKIVSEVADEIPTLLRDGMKEYELAAEISYGMQKRGATGPSFDSIVAFGEGSGEPHYAPHDVPLQKSQFVLCDFGAYYEKYASDLTRTWIRGPATPDMKDIYDTVLRAENAALAAVRAGAKGGDVHLAADNLINATKWKGRFIHSVGHSLGLAVHDGPALHPRFDWTLEEGMVVTIEPGIYVPGIGGVRIEDDIVVTRDGYEMLTSAKRELQIV